MNIVVGVKWIARYYKQKAIIEGDVNREQRFLESLGKGDEEKGMKELLHILNSYTLSAKYLNRGNIDKKVKNHKIFIDLSLERYSNEKEYKDINIFTIFDNYNYFRLQRVLN